jgi:acyl-CoA thioesterase-2
MTPVKSRSPESSDTDAAAWSSLEETTRLEGGEGRYRVDLSAEWLGMNALYGGYIAAVMLRGAAATSGFDRAASHTCHFLSGGRPGPAELRVTSLRHNKRSESMRVSMHQDGRAVAESLTWMGREGDGFELDFEPMPEAPGPEGLPERADLVRRVSDFFPPVFARLGARFCDRVPFSAARPDEPEVDWWLRVNREPPPTSMLEDALRITALMDATFHDPLYQIQGGDPRDYAFGAPTMELSMRFHRAVLDTEWFFCRSKIQVAAAGLVTSAVRFWSEGGLLVASGSSNLACRPIGAKRS